MKRTGKMTGSKKAAFMAAVTLLTASLPATALADGLFEGDIVISNASAGYEYKVYEVLETAGAGGQDSIFMAEEQWKDFLETNENAIEMLTPNDNDLYKEDEESMLYTVNMESDKAVRRAFAEDVLQYAQENGIEATESMTAEGGQVSFTRLVLGIYVIDTAGGARVTVMWDMDWQSEIKDSYDPSAQETENTAAETEKVPAVEAEEIPGTKEETENSAEESGTDQGVGADTEAEQEEAPLTAEEEVPKEKGSIPVVTAVVAAVLAAVLILFYLFKKHK